MAATSSLEEVRLRDNQIEDAGAAALAQTLRFCSNLRRGRGACQIGCEGCVRETTMAHMAGVSAALSVAGCSLGMHRMLR